MEPGDGMEWPPAEPGGELHDDLAPPETPPRTRRRRRLPRARDVAAAAFGILVITLIMGIPLGVSGSILAIVVPMQVNSVAYLGGWEAADTFMPVSHSKCHRDCSKVTYGYLTGDGDAVTWNACVPLHQPFTVRAPVLAWWQGRNLIAGTGTAVGFVALALFLEAIALLVLAMPVKVLLSRALRLRP